MRRAALSAFSAGALCCGALAVATPAAAELLTFSSPSGSAPSGMTCRDDSSGHGFFVSSQSYQMF